MDDFIAHVESAFAILAEDGIDRSSLPRIVDLNTYRLRGVIA
jgi:hypothetical protein